MLNHSNIVTLSHTLPFSSGLIRTTQENTSFVVTNDASEWILLSFAFTSMYLLAFFKMPQIKASYRQMSAISFVTSILFVFPFAYYVVTGISWTGMGLNEIHRRLIDDRHAILMGLWMVFSPVQLLSYIFKNQKIHNIVGGWVVNYLLPLIFLELFCNASFVFWPEKTYNLAAIVTSANGLPIPASHHDLSDYEKIVYTLPWTTALMVPVMMVMYYWLSNQALDRSNNKKRDVKLHVVYMCIFISTTLSPGAVRWFIRKSFQRSHCVPQTDTSIASLMQYMGQTWAGYIYPTVAMAVYLTLPLDTRKNDWRVKWSFVFNLVVGTFFTPIAGWYAGIPAGIQCV